jgi:hypothetical protein
MDNIPIRQMVDAGLYGRKSGPQKRVARAAPASIHIEPLTLWRSSRASGGDSARLSTITLNHKTNHHLQP